MWTGLRALRYIFSPGLDGHGGLRTAVIRAERLRRRDRWRYSLRRRLPAVDRIPLDRPILVLGLQGGGTTLIARCLLRSDCVVSMSGNSEYWVATNELGFVRNRMAALPQSLWSSSHRTDLEHSLFGSEHDSVWACDALLPSYRRTAEDVVPAEAERFKRVLREHIAVYARDREHARFLDKTHTNTVKIPYLNALLEGCDPFFLLVLRNPYTMCTRAARRKPPSWRRSPSHQEQLGIAASHWENAYRIALEDGERTGRFAAVRFEDFVRAPEAIVRAVCAAVQLEFDPGLVPAPGQRFPFATLPTDSKWYPLQEDPWRAEVDDGEAEIIDARCAKLAERLGYRRVTEETATIPSVLTVGRQHGPEQALAAT